jgi:hypothetical protein
MELAPEWAKAKQASFTQFHGKQEYKLMFEN